MVHQYQLNLMQWSTVDFRLKYKVSESVVFFKICIKQHTCQKHCDVLLCLAV
jgi:hypothetical protein